MENLSLCAVWVVLGQESCSGGARMDAGMQRKGCREDPPSLPVWEQGGLTSCCSPWCSPVPANCCSSRLGASRGSGEMLCCQCWKCVHFDPAVFLTCQRLKTGIELSSAGSWKDSCCLPCGQPRPPGIKHSCTISPLFNA